MPSPRDTGPNGIKEIADALGISIGTVDRALHDRRGVSEATRARVLKMAQRLRYTPNFAARSLKLNRQLKLGVYLPRQIASYFDALREGMQDAAQSESSASVELVFHEYELLGRGDIEVIRKSDWLAFDGLVIAPGHPRELATFARDAAERNKPLVFVSTDAPRLPRLCSIATDAYVSGSIAAELLGGWIFGHGRAVLFTGDLQVQDHADKLRGFAATLATSAQHLTLAPVVETHDSFDEAYRAARRILTEEQDLRGIYVNTANCLPVLQAVREAGRNGVIRIVTTDLFPELIPFLETGDVSASLYQRPYTQGKLAVETLRAFLMGKVQPEVVTRLAPHIILRSNLSLFAESLERRAGSGAQEVAADGK